MNNMNDYYAGRESENTAVFDGDDPEDQAMYSADSERDSDDDGYMSDDFDRTETGPAGLDDTTDGIEISSFMGDAVDDESVRVFPAPAAYPIPIQGVLQALKTHNLVQEIASDVASTRSLSDGQVTSLAKEYLRKWVDNAATDSCDTNEDIPIESIRRAGNNERPTTVSEIIDQVLHPDQVRWTPATSSSVTPDEPSLYAGIAEISRLFTLNELQHGAFAIIATHLLRRWKPAPCTSAEPVSNEDL
jgi:hypothetical protein